MRFITQSSRQEFIKLWFEYILQERAYRPTLHQFINRAPSRTCENEISTLALLQSQRESAHDVTLDKKNKDKSWQ
jgi:hypothetical protein